MTRSQSAAPALAGQCLDARDLVVLGDAGTHRVGFAVVRAVEVAAAVTMRSCFLQSSAHSAISSGLLRG